MEDGDGEGADYYGGRILFCVSSKLSSQEKVDGAQAVESWVRGAPHGHDYLSHRAYVLLHASFVDRLVVDCKDDHVDLVIEDL